MRYGQGWGMFWGDPDVMVIILGVIDTGDGLAITFIVIAGYDQYFQLVIDGRNSGTPVFVKAGQSQTLRGSYNFPASPHLYSVEPMGPYAQNTWFDVTWGQVLFSSGRSDRLHAEIVAVPKQFSVSGV